ncbi:MAG: Trm112 family protein [bacterium]
MLLNSKILDVIACPICKGKLHYDKTAQELICNFDKLAYPIEDGVPIMIADKARKIEQRYKK